MTLDPAGHRRACPEDLPELLVWLEADQLDHGEGFWPHRDMICDGVEQNDLYLATYLGEVAGFQLGETKVDLIQVRWSYRCQGFGSLLVKHALHRAYESGVTLCFADVLDKRFWVAQGFAEYGPSETGGKGLMAIHVPTWSRQQASGCASETVEPASH